MSEWQASQQQQGWDANYQQQQSQWAAPASGTAWADPQSQYAAASQQTQWGAQPQQQQQQQWAGYPQQTPSQGTTQSWNVGQQAQAQQQPWAPVWSSPQLQLGDPMLNAGLQAGAHMVQQQAELAAKRYMPGVSSLWGTLRTYFHVNNAFVIKKLSTMLFPFAKKDWSRTATLEPPASDPNAPDLYLPLMALSTYVLTVGLAKGTSMTFDPEVIVDVFGSSLMVQLVQVGIMRIALWTVGPWAPQLAWFDLFAFSGYQYVGVALNMLVGLIFGHSFYMLSLLWTATCAAFVMFRTMQSAVPPPEPGQRGKRRRVYFLVTCAILQIVFMWFLGFTRELKSAGLFSYTGAAIQSAGSGNAINGDTGYVIPPPREDVAETASRAAGTNEEPIAASSSNTGAGAATGGNRGGARRKKRAGAANDPADV